MDKNKRDIDPDMMVLPDELIDQDMMVEIPEDAIYNRNDKIKKMGKKEKIPAYIFADPDDPSIIYIRTNGMIELLDNSLYEVVIPKLEFDDGDVEEKFSHKFLTGLSPCYVNVEDVLTLCRNIKLDSKDVLLHIRSASQIIDYWAFKDDNIPKDFGEKILEPQFYPFYAFVKYKAAVESLKEFYIGAITEPYKYKDVLSDLARQEEMDLAAIKKLIDDLNTEAEEYLNYVVTMTADPEWALRGKYSVATDFYSGRAYHPTHIDRKGGNGWNRGY